VSTAAAEPRTLAPPERRVARIVSNEALGAYRVLSALDTGGPADPRPGQFYMLAGEERWGGGEGERPYLPRAFSYARAARGEGGVRLDFLLEAIGPGTERLAELEPGDGLALVGPLGVGFRPPASAPRSPPVSVSAQRALLVGGGIGTAPLVCLSDALPGCRILLGFRSAPHAAAARLFPGEVALATDDGSAGRPALVTELLREELDRDARATVYACGPPPMLEAVRALCAERGVPAQLALESGMACGFGACFGCVVPTRDGYLRLCLDGPVLDAERLESALFPGAGHS
jgi:dihydroorotate dehydrogenase electron transfer subunit